MKSNPRLTPKETHYIAVMGAAAMRCEYMVAIEEEQFLYYGGDPAWVRYGLKGMITRFENSKEEEDSESWDLMQEKSMIRKLQRLSELNDVLAQMPWTLTKDAIARTLSCDMDGDMDSCWKPEELVSAVLILLHTHSLSSIAMSQGVVHLTGGGYSSFYAANSPHCGPLKGNMSLPSLSPLPAAVSENSERP